MRLDAGAFLKRCHHLEAALVRTCAGWIPSVHAIETKALLAKLSWESALTAGALRERVFEMRFPSRLMDVGVDEPLVAVFRASAHAPSSTALLEALARTYFPTLIKAHGEYLEATDALADAPSRRFLEQSIREKTRAISDLEDALADELLATGPDHEGSASAWLQAIDAALAEVGGVGPDEPPELSMPAVLPPGRSYAIPVDPARDGRYLPCTFYWPDTLDPEYGYGSGIRLQLRSAVSHLNEVWAVEVAGAALYELSDVLGWEFTADAARWTYDESRHMLMGQRRLAAWGLDPAEIPLGRYIYDASAAGGDPIYRIGMLGFFETKNIGKKKTRARAFGSMGDPMSQRDMQFDWADETIHAEYGRRWLKRLLEAQGRSADDYSAILDECEALVSECKTGVSPEELATVVACAERLVSRSEQLAADSGE
jgi:hypothetical protein